MNVSPGMLTRRVGTRTAPRQAMLSGQFVFLALVASVTWLALIGSVLGAHIVGNSSFGAAVRQLATPATTFDTNGLVPTSFGSLSVTAVALKAENDEPQLESPDKALVRSR